MQSVGNFQLESNYYYCYFNHTFFFFFFSESRISKINVSRMIKIFNGSNLLKVKIGINIRFSLHLANRYKILKTFKSIGVLSSVLRYGLIFLKAAFFF